MMDPENSLGPEQRHDIDGRQQYCRSHGYRTGGRDHRDYFPSNWLAQQRYRWWVNPSDSAGRTLAGGLVLRTATPADLEGITQLLRNGVKTTMPATWN